MTLSAERIKELDLWLYIQSQVKALEPVVGTIAAHTFVSDDFMRWQQRFGIAADTNVAWVSRLVKYNHIHQWEWILYLTAKGKTPKQIADLLGIKPNSVSVVKITTSRYRENTETLERWMKTHEIGYDMQRLWERTEIQKLAIPPGDFSGLLRESI